METLGWESLPHDLLIDVLRRLVPGDRFSASLVCQAWNQCFHCSYVWSKFIFRFMNPDQAKCLQAIEGIGSYINDVQIIVDQFESKNRLNACKALAGLAQLPERKIKSLKIQFVGENPILYGGQEFLDALTDFLGVSCNTASVVSSLTTVDLGSLNISLNGTILKALCSNHPHLTNLNIQNRSLVCKVSPDDVLHLVTNCRELRNLSIFYCSLSDEVLAALSSGDRQPLKHLSLLCRWQDKFTKDVSSASWAKLVRATPDLRVTLAFDHSCLMLTVNCVMKPEIPVSVLRLETFTELSLEIVRACSYYKKTLQKVIVECPKSHTSEDLDEAIVKLSAECKHLRSLHVFCVLQRDTVDRILAEHPEMHSEGRYTLKYIPEPHPWTAGRDCDE